MTIPIAGDITMLPLNHRRPQVLTARSPRPEARCLWPGWGHFGFPISWTWINIGNTNKDMIEGSLEVKLPTIWTVEKQR